MMKSDKSPRENAPLEQLTWREQEVLALMAERLTNREIAAQLHLAESTVKDYVGNILGKLYVKNRRQAVERARELGLLEPGGDAETDPGPKTNLPAETVPFIGRLVELEEIREASARSRLLTLIGPGGIGKTRLALKAAADADGDFENGSFFVALAPIPSVEHMVQTIAEALNFPLATHEDPQHQLLRYLKKKQLLLVMDNFEHLLDGTEIVNEILLSAPAVKILVTSRERLNLQSETVLTIRGMDLPSQVEEEDVLTYDAITIFLQNARKVRPTFNPSYAELKQITSICQLVQGLPLAIELSAGWLHILSLDEIANELESGFDILATEMKDAPERHRSIRTVFDHSWSLLENYEQDVVMLLSVFRGGFRREAAQEVAGASLGRLGGLVNKSILFYHQDTGRFEIHELLRQYSYEQLELSSLAYRSAHEDHASYFAEFMGQKWGHLKDSRQVAALNEIDADLENIRAAWRYYLDKADARQLQKFINSFWRFYWIRGWNHAAAELFGNAVEALDHLSGDDETEAVRATAMANQGFFMAWLGLADQGYGQVRVSVTILERLNHHEGLVFAYNSLSLIAYYLDRFSEEKEATDRLLEIARASGEKWLVGLALALSGMSAFREKDYLEAESLSEASLAESDEISDAMVSILSRNTLGHVAVVNGELTKAKTCFLHCMRESEKIGFRWAVGNATKYLGQVALLEGDFLEAETYFLQSLRIADDLGLNRDIANHLYEFAKLRVAQGRVTEAVELLVVLLQQPASRQARLGRGRIRDSAQALLGEIEADLLPVTYSSVLEGGWEAELDEAIAALLDVKKGG